MEIRLLLERSIDMSSANPKRFLDPSNGRFYTLGEELFNSISHGIGVLAAIACCAVIIVFAAFTRDPWKIVSASVYGACMILLFLFSTLYHSLTNSTAKKVFRAFDHLGIFLLIAGSYTPITLVTLRGPLGWTLFGIVWSAATLGIIFNSISVERFKKFSMIAYITTGWAVLLAIVPLVRQLPAPGILLMVLGGAAYTVGIWFYKKKSIRYMHSVWHLFVLAGALLQYFAILFYVIL